MKETDFSKREILKYVGDLSQVFGSRECILSGGRAQGVRAVDIRNGSGLEFTVLPDRCMDIARMSYKGFNFSYISKVGISAPQYYDDDGEEFLRNFFGGFLTTCGLSNVGTPCTDNGESYGLHGRISNTPGENVVSGIEWDDDRPTIEVKGRMREAKLFGENLVLERRITCRAGENQIRISDKVENYGFRKEPLMLLYHFNMGYPLLDEDAVFVVPENEVKARDEEAQKGIDKHNVFQKPEAGFKEQVFSHDLKADKSGNTCAALINEKLGLGIAIRFNKSQLFNLTQWKQMGQGDYVLGIEPGNCYVIGREESRKKGLLEHVEPGEVRNFEVLVEILDGIRQINMVRDEIARL